MSAVLLTLDYRVKNVPATTGNIVIDANEANIFDINLTDNGVLKAPLNPQDGQTILIRLQPNTKSFALEQGVAGGFAFSDSAPASIFSVSTAANKLDFIGAVYSASKSRWLVTNLMKGF